IGFVVSFAVFKVSPVIYEARALIEMRMRRASYTGVQQAVIETDLMGNMSEVFNTRLARLKSRAVLEQIVTQYRSDNPSSTVTDGELISTLLKAELALQRMSRLITISIRSTDAQLAADLANAYSKVAVAFTSDQNKNESEVAVAWLVSTAVQERRQLDQADKAMLDYSTANKLETMKREMELKKSALSSISAEVLQLESQISTASEIKATLEGIQGNPDRFGNLPLGVPRGSEIAAAYQKRQSVKAELNAMLVRLTPNHPDVKMKEQEIGIYTKEFADVVARSLETATANLDLLQRQLSQLTPKRDALMTELTELEQNVIASTLKIEQLQRERQVAEQSYQMLLKRKGEAELAADEDTAIIKPVEQAFKPTKPVLPNPMVIFPAGPALGMVLGIFFVLVLDHLEDKIVGITDIEQRLRLKVLAVMPHVRRTKREQLARLVSNDKFSQYAEAMAGLRNLLDSPRYHEMSKVLLCISTQPGEGKTVTSCSLAQSCAQSGQKTLMVDFDMRRPRLARIFQKKPGKFQSLPHVLAKADTKLFDNLPVQSGVPNLDVVLSRASSNVNPANLMGSEVIVDFFKWAREHYDRVFIDSPPFGIVGDVMTLSALVDSVMIMCCPDRTRFQPVKHASRSLTEAGARVIGVIVNDVDFGRRNQFSQSDYHYRYSYRYTSRYGAYGYGYGASRHNKAGKLVTDKDGNPIPKEGQPAAEGEASSRSYNDDLTPHTISRQDAADATIADDE
ncbi:MAG: AAA family ATPase, partial [Kiritimatiellae bacterium]|nr:AAA family ATPase [Kiritimatiellia bacterium]